MTEFADRAGQTDNRTKAPQTQKKIPAPLPGLMGRTNVIRLQRTIGNEAVGRLLTENRHLPSTTGRGSALQAPGLLPKDSRPQESPDAKGGRISGQAQVRVAELTGVDQHAAHSHPNVLPFTRPLAPIQRFGGTGGEEEEEQYAEPGDYYGIDDISNADPRDFVELLDNGGLQLEDLEGGGLTKAKKLKLLEVAAEEQATSAIYDLWASFKDLELVAMDNYELWADCLDAGASLLGLPGIAPLEELFRLDVAYVRDLSLIMSRESAEEERDRYGLVGEQEGLDPDAHLSRQEALDQFQAVAAVVSAAVEAQELLRQTPIGYAYPLSPEEDYYSNEGDPGNAGLSKMVPVYFDPLDSEDRGDLDAPAEHDWIELKDLYDESVDVIAYWTEKTPALYTVMKGNLDSGQLLDLSDFAKQEHALQTIDQGLSDVIAAIDRTEGAQLDPLDLIPVHKRLYAGYGQDIGVLKPWDHPFYQSIAKNLVERHEQSDWWSIAGLGLAGATILVSIAVGGPIGIAAAALLGATSAGLGVAEAATRFEKAEDLAVAADTQMRDEWAIVEQDQAVAEHTKAQLALIFAGLDALGIVPEVRALGALSKASRAASASDELLESAAKVGAKSSPQGGPTLEEVRRGEPTIEPGSGTPATGGLPVGEDVAVTNVRWEKRGARLSLPGGKKRTYAAGEYWPEGADKPDAYLGRSGKSDTSDTSSLTDPERHVLAPPGSEADPNSGIPSGLTPEERKEWLEVNKTDGFHPGSRAHDAEANMFERLLKDTDSTSVGEFHFKVSHPGGPCPACKDMIFRFRAERPGIQVIQH